MPTYRYTTTLPYTREHVFAWFERPGAVVRLTPGFGGSIRREPSDGIRKGSTAVLGIAAPGMVGLALGALRGTVAGPLHLPGWLRVEVPWRARHVVLDEGSRFVDVMETGPLKSWRHTHTFSDLPVGVADAGPEPGSPPGSRRVPGTVMTDEVEYELPILSGRSHWVPVGAARGWAQRQFEKELDRIFAFRERQLRADLAFHAAHRSAPLTIAVSGASGLIGTQLCALLAGGGHSVLRLVRRPARSTGEIQWDPSTGTLDAEALRGCDAVVNLAGHAIGGRLTPRTKALILDSRVSGTRLLATALADLAGDGRQRSLVCSSGIGYYGAAPPSTVPLTEDAPAGDDFLAHVCEVWEAACEPAAQAGVRVANLRTGVVLAPNGGMLQRLLPLYLAGVGGPLGRDQWLSWIGLDDTAGLYAHAVLSAGTRGPMNVVAPHPVTAPGFAKTLGRVLGRPAVVPVPAIGPRLVLGNEGAREIAQASQRVSSAKAEASGYTFRHQNLEEAIRHSLGREPAA